MKKQDFVELIDSVREAGQILRGEAKPSREFTFTPEDVRAISSRRVAHAMTHRIIRAPTRDSKRWLRHRTP